jgi:hypothetical protein
VLWTDQSRRPSAIDAPSHHGFDPYRHFEAKYSKFLGQVTAGIARIRAAAKARGASALAKVSWINP